MLFSLKTDDRLELFAPEWLDENYYSLDDIMTAIVARLVELNHRIDGKYITDLNDLWGKIHPMPSETYVWQVIAGLSITVYLMPSGSFELVTYKTL